MIAEACRENMRAIALAYGQATGLSTKQISKKFYGLTNFLPLFLKGKGSISVDKFDKMIAAFDADWPDGAEWPIMRAAIIKRPKSRKANHPDNGL